MRTSGSYARRSTGRLGDGVTDVTDKRMFDVANRNKTGEMRAAETIGDIAPAEFFERVAGVIEGARRFVGRTADITMTVTYFAIGQMIV